MKKKMIVVVICGMMLTMTACGSQTSQPIETNETEKTEVKEEQKMNTSMEQILDDINNDFDTTIAEITTELEKTKTETDTYEKYIANKQKISDWYALVQTKSSELFERTNENSKEYYKQFVKKIDMDDYDAVDDAEDDFYDAVYDDAMDKYYDEIYDGLMDDVYDTYYDDMLDDAYDNVEYEEWSAESQSCYREWSDNSSMIYSAWSDESSYIYKIWSENSSAFYEENYDIDAIFKQVEQEIEEEKKEEAEETAASEDANADNSDQNATDETTGVDNSSEDQTVASTDNQDASGIRPEFKEAMDSYEAFFDEYCEFMKTYSTSSDPTSLLTQYADYMTKYTDAMTKIEEMGNEEMSDEELVYYTEVMGRIQTKLAETSTAM